MLIKIGFPVKEDRFGHKTTRMFFTLTPDLKQVKTGGEGRQDDLRIFYTHPFGILAWFADAVINITSVQGMNYVSFKMDTHSHASSTVIGRNNIMTGKKSK